MLALEDIRKSTANLFEDETGLKKPVVPEPTVLWKDKLEALKEAGLTQQHESALFEMRCWQAEQMGFQKLAPAAMVEMLMGESHTKQFDGDTRQNHEWTYDHHNDKSLGKDWGGKPTIYQRWERKGPWYLPPFFDQLSWECQFGKLDYLRREIPHGVVLRINECKELKLFNSFSVMAPKEAWERKTTIDPILVANIWELAASHKEVVQSAQFFIAQW